MTQSMVTIVAPLNPRDLDRANTAIDRMGNPASDAIRARLDAIDDAVESRGSGTHFISLHALPSFTAGKAHLVLEFSADGTPAQGIARIAKAIGDELATIFALAPDFSGYDIAAYLTAHQIETGFGFGQLPGVGHCGSPGMTVGRIRAERDLSAAVDKVLAAQKGDLSALERLDAARKTIGAESPVLKPGDALPAFKAASTLGVVASAAVAFVRTYLWPVAALLGVWMLAVGVWRVRGTIADMADLRAFADGLWWAFRWGAPVLIVALLVGLAVAYIWFRRLESIDWTSDRAPDRHVLNDIALRENHCAQNHMMSLTERKPGLLRQFTSLLAFWAIATITPLRFRPGYLGPVGTIHYARWVTLPGTRDLVFFSNYGGSWEAYLEDFITLSHQGLTGVWSNTLGFPKTENLFINGATDGERFKRYARQSMLPTRFWYSAYPELTTDHIRANADIRRGLSGAMTEDDAVAWLAHFGSAARPATKMVTTEIQSLVFGGLGFLNYSALTLWTLPDDCSAARAWLRKVAPHIAYNDGRRVRDDDRINAIVQFAPSAQGLAKLGLSKTALDTFPPAFLDDMMHPARARILGDVGLDAPDHWDWGRAPSDVAVLVYGQNLDAFAELSAELAEIGRTHGATLSHRVDMQIYDRSDNKEPFGFEDGISQPVIYGTYKGLRTADPLHLVEAGEIVLGYPDNRGNLPPGPVIDAIDDPANHLPVLDDSEGYGRNTVNNPRDLGHNGSFLVIRQLEQDVEAFDAYCATEAQKLRDRTRLGPPYDITPEFIGAKMMGRWKNGAALVRSPYTESRSEGVIEANDFWLGREDPEALRCPLGAHIRRANPRDSLDPGSTPQVDISNRHRIMRIGRKYATRPGERPGILFMALNGDIERQFEFVQQTWLHGNIISLSCPTSLVDERDPVLGGGAQTNSGFTIPSRDGPVKLDAPPRFVTVKGGGYFFLAGKRLVTWLSQ